MQLEGEPNKSLMQHEAAATARTPDFEASFLHLFREQSRSRLVQQGYSYNTRYSMQQQKSV